jgi:DNA end-binding protein Ku
MAQSVWKGYISFGLVSVPIRLLSAARALHVQFHEIHRQCGSRVRQQLYCPHDKRVVSRDEITMGFEVDKDEYLLVGPEELKRLQPASSKAMDIVQFVKISEVDPIYFETSYFCIPEEAGRRAYGLLLRTMVQMEIAAIAQVTMHQRERTVVIRPYQEGLTLHTIYYPNEIHAVAGYGKNNPKDIKKQEVSLAEQFAKALIRPFQPEQFRDEYQTRVQQLIKSKNKGQPVPQIDEAKKFAPVIDLMEALRKSIAGKETKLTASRQAKKLKKSA